MRKKIESYLAIFSAFMIGVLLAGFISVKYYTLSLLENVYIRSNAMETYKAVSTLELLREEKIDTAIDFLEWQADEGLMGLSEYMGNPRLKNNLDDFALQSIAKSREYRERYPRETISKATDTIVKGVLSADKPRLTGGFSTRRVDSN